MDILALQEIRWKQVNIITLQHYTLLNSGSSNNSLGTGFMIKNDLKHTVLNYEAANERLCMIRLKGRFFNISMISAHALMEDAPEEDKDEFYGLLERSYDRLPNFDVKIVLGDMNAKVGKEEYFKPAIGIHSKHSTSNNNGIRLVDFANGRNLRISSTLFPHKNIHKETWESPDGRTRNQIDHILVNRRHATDIKDVRSFRGAQCGSDHFMVRVRYRQKLSTRPRGRPERGVAYNVEKLIVEQVNHRFRGKIEENLSTGSSTVNPNIEERWFRLKRALNDAAEEVLGRKTYKRREGWFDEECETVVKERNEARVKMLQRRTRLTQEDYKRKRKKVKVICRQKKRRYEREKLEKVQSDFEAKKSRKFYKEVRDIKVGFQPRIDYCRDEKGNLLASKQDIQNRWASYFRNMFDKQEEVRQVENHQLELDNGEENDDGEVPPEKEEIEGIIASLKNYKAPGADGIQAELLKYGGGAVAEQIYKLIWDIWMNESMPKEWSNAVLCPVYKKGDKLKCENYRGIALLSVGYKILSIAIYRKLIVQAENILGEYQCGFRPGRATTDHIFTCRQILEKSYEYNVDLNHLFIDFKQAYDSIDRQAALADLRTLGISRKLIRLVNLTWKGTNGQVKVQNSLSESFPIKNGLRQGDPLSPVIFNLCLEKAIRAIKTNQGGTIFNRMTQHLAYADDVLIIGRTRAALEGAFEEFERAAKVRGLEINKEKTKFMRTSRRQTQREEQVQITNHTFQTCDKFKYLGSVLTENCDVSSEIKERLTAGNRCLYGLMKALRFRNLSRSAKLTIYKTIIRPVVMYGSETWVLTQHCESLLKTWERKVLRKIYGPICINGEWRIRKNEELQRLYGEPDIVSCIKKGRLRWLGHVERMPHHRIPRKTLYGHPGGARCRGRPRIRWMDDVEADLRKGGVRRWRQRAVEREEWKALLNEVQVLL